jgi:hypothetical protein
MDSGSTTTTHTARALNIAVTTGLAKRVHAQVAKLGEREKGCLYTSLCFSLWPF